MKVGSNTNLFLTDDTGNCLTSSATSGPSLPLNFGLTTKIQCLCISFSVVPQLFAAFSGANIQQFPGDTTKLLKLPSLTDISITDVQINFIVGTYGSQGSVLMI